MAKVVCVFSFAFDWKSLFAPQHIFGQQLCTDAYDHPLAGTEWLQKER